MPAAIVPASLVFIALFALIQIPIALATHVVGIFRAAGMIFTFTPMLGFGVITLVNLL